eukprot:TRINITY_DN13269_c0_g1_i1.p1 TRINITY_DN13269_c0_g1~~TRINITY_DN13269_c0_g1_i1.p1  ORF type:complete len:938 (+),score=213.53 TRINITY_DN13269_c0_g1_i1:54-2816(+)
MDDDEMAKFLGFGDSSPRAPKPAAKGRRAGPAPMLTTSTPTGEKPLSSKLNEDSDDDDDPPLDFLGSSQPKRRAPQLTTTKQDNAPTPVASSSSPLPSPSVQRPIRQPSQQQIPIRADNTAQREELERHKKNSEAAAEELASLKAEHKAKNEKLKECEERLWKLEVENNKLAEEKKLHSEMSLRTDREREDSKRELDNIRNETVRILADNQKLTGKVEDLTDVQAEVKVVKETLHTTQKELSAEKRKVTELLQAQADHSHLPYTPPPEVELVGKDVPHDAPLSVQFQIMLHNTAKSIVGYQKEREEVMMSSLRQAQQKWSDEMSDRERARAKIEKDELEKWRFRAQEERQDREKRDIEERILRSQRDEQERTDRERRHREEKADLLQQELQEREQWASRIHDEHQKTIERITLGFSATQEQMTHSYEQQLRLLKQQSEEERVHNRKIAEQQRIDMEKKYIEMSKQQESSHKEVVGSLMQFQETMQKLSRCENLLQLNSEQQSSLKAQWDKSMNAVKKEKEQTLTDREAMLNELRKAVSEKHQQVDNERLMLSRLFADFKVTIDNIKRQQEDERSRLTASTTRAEKAKEDYEREHRKWMRDCLQQRIDLDSDHTTAIQKVLSSVEDLKQERGLLQQERRDFERSRETHNRHITEQEAKIEDKKKSLESLSMEIVKKEDSVRQAGDKIHVKMMELQQEATVITTEKEKLRDEMYRVKDLGNMAYQKSKDLQKVREEILAVAEVVQAEKSQVASGLEKRKKEDEVRLDKEKNELEKMRHSVASEELALRRKKVLFPKEAVYHEPKKLSIDTIQELFEQKQFIAHEMPRNTSGVAVPNELTISRATTVTQPSPFRQSKLAVPPPSMGVSDPSPSSAKDELPESLLGQQWVSLFKLSTEEGSSDSLSGRPSTYHSSPYTSSPSNR